MPKIEWDKIGERLYETGIDHVVLYEYVDGEYKNGVPWNGVTSLTENKSGAEPSPLYADNIKYLVLKSLEEYGLTIECYTYPKEFEKCNGIQELTPGVKIGQQVRSSFGLSFRTLIGNDVDHEGHGYKLHLVYGCDASPSEESNSTINDSPEAKTMSFEITTTPVAVDGKNSTSTVVIDSTDEKAKAHLYGEDPTDAETKGAYMPLPKDLLTLFSGD